MMTPLHARDSAQVVPSRSFPVYRFVDLTIDCGKRLVLRGDDVVNVSGLSFDLFVVLLQGAPNIVTSDELMQRVWRGVVVNPETISQRVKLLRHALGDDARAPRYISVVRGRGYRAIAAVEPAPQERSRPRGWPKSRVIFLIAAVMALLIVGVVAISGISVR
jgi:DNA-binding winged helix-turn-helix (wHTH) protein